MIRFLKGRAVVGSLFAVVMAVALVEAQAPPAGRSGFRALTGQDAAAFTVPGDMRLVARGRAGNGVGAVARYRQFVGDAEVLGGQISVYTDGAGHRTAVIGAHYPGLRPMAGPRIGPAAAQAVAAARRPDLTGEWRADLMVRPDTASYFYRVEVRDLASRWFFWIDAETGAATNEYDGLTTGSGTRRQRGHEESQRTDHVQQRHARHVDRAADDVRRAQPPDAAGPARDGRGRPLEHSGAHLSRPACDGRRPLLRQRHRRVLPDPPRVQLAGNATRKACARLSTSGATTTTRGGTARR